MYRMSGNFLKILIFLLLVYAFSLSKIATAALKCEEIKKIPTTSKVIALTFDDGPDPDITPRILEILYKNNIKATFFVVGEKALLHSSILKDIYAQGHTIGNHSFSHIALDDKDKSTIKKEILLTNLIIKILTNSEPNIFRAPYYRCSKTLNNVLKEMKIKHIGYTYADFNKKTKSSDFIKFIINNLTPGMIILIHEHKNISFGYDKRPTVFILEELIQEIKQRGYEFVSF